MVQHRCALLVLGVWALAAGCGIRRHPDVRSGAVPSAEARIYAAVLRDAQRNARQDSLRIESQTVVFGGIPQGVLSRQRVLAVLPAGLIERLATISAVPRDVRMLPLPARTRVVAPDESRQLQERGRGGLAIFGLSPIAFSDDSANALVVVRSACGPLCGGATAVWYAADPAGTWRKRGEFLLDFH